MSCQANNLLFQDNSDDDNDGSIFKSISQFVPSRGIVALVDELTAFLKSPTEWPEGGNALRWWHRNKSTYPHLSLMAMDYLSIPGESVI